MVAKIKQIIRETLEHKYNVAYETECNKKMNTYKNWLKEYRQEGNGLYQPREWKKWKQRCSVLEWRELENIIDTFSKSESFS